MRGGPPSLRYGILSRRLPGFSESVTETTHGLDARAELPQFSSQGHDVNVACAVEDDDVSSQHVVNQFSAGKYALCNKGSGAAKIRIQRQDSAVKCCLGRVQASKLTYHAISEVGGDAASGLPTSRDP